MNALKPEKKLAIVSALVEGNSIRSTERMTGVHRDTILRLLVRVGERCQQITDPYLQGVESKLIQADEIWTYVQKKERQLTEFERKNRELGDQYVFVAIDAETKLVPCFTVGKRDGVTARAFVSDLQARLQGGTRIQLTTDGFQAYVEAVDIAFGQEVDYAQQIKVYATDDAGRGRYSPPRVTEVLSNVICGDPNLRLISTSYVERQNLTMRMSMRRFTRLTNAFSKKLENLRAALALHFAYYNFIRIHRSLRVTPAMASGVTPRIWKLEELLA